MPWLRRRLTSRSAPCLVRTNTSVRPRLRTQLGDQRLEPVFLLNRHEPVLDVGAGAPFGRSALVHRCVPGVSPGHAARLAVERRGEEQRLARAGALRDDPVDSGAKAHVEHPVGLVEHEDPDRVEREGAAGEQILEATGGRDEHVRAGGVLCLLGQADAAVDGGHAERARMRDRADVVDDLRRELARRRQHERGGSRTVGVRSLHDRDPERKRLARAGGRLCEHVATGQDVARSRRAGSRTAP